MFSTITQKILISFLGDYIDGIRNSMDIALLKGRIRVENVSLKRDFFDNLSLPLRLGFSRVESIDVHIPWTNLKQKPTTVEVNGIYALFYVNYELSEYKFDVEARFQQMIDKATDMIKMKFQEKQRDSDSTIEKYILRIIDNIKVRIRNVHIRLESVERGWDFSLGLLINKIGVETVNQNGQKHFFVRARHHHHPHLHRKFKTPGEETLFKKVKVQNVDIYFTQTERQFLTLIEDKQTVLTKMKSFLIDMELHEAKDALNSNFMLRLKVDAMLRARLNENSKYDIDVKAMTCPLIINLTDRMTAELFYFLQFAFEWRIQKYKKPNKDACMTPQMINFYKLILANVLQDIPLHKNDYKTVLKLIQEWDYDFLNQITLEFIQDQKVRRELSRRRNQKILEDPVRLEEFKKEIEDRILTEDEKKQMFDIIGKVGFDFTVPNLQIVLTKSEQAREMFGLKNQVILTIGLENIAVTMNTVLSKETTFTMAIQDFVLQQGDRHKRPQIMTQKPSLQSFMTVIYTRAQLQHAESCSIKISKRLISLSESLVSDMFSWFSMIRLRPATIHYLKEILVHYFTEIVKKYLLRLFKEFRVINLNLALPIISIGLSEGRDVMIVDLGRIEGRNLSEKIYRFALVEDAKIMVDEKPVLTIEEGTMVEIVDKIKILTGQKILELTDREKISIKVRSVKIENLDKMIEFSTRLIGSPIIEQFLRLKIVEDHSLLLEGSFYLNNNPRRQRIILKSDRLHFLPSRYSIELRRCKVYQMRLEKKNYLVLHSLVTNKTDVVEVDDELTMETIFYKLREVIHENATSAEWDMFYKSDYPVMIDQLQILKSKSGENLPLFSFEVEIGKILIPLEKYLRRGKSIQESYRSPVNLPHTNVLKFLQTNDTAFLETNVSKIQFDKIFMTIGFYQLTTDFFSEIRDVKVIIEDQPIFNNLSFALSCMKSEYLLVNFNLHSFEMMIHNKEVLKKMFQIGIFFQDHIQSVFRAIKDSNLMNRIEVITRENEQFSILSSSHSLTQHQPTTHGAWFQERTKLNVTPQTLLSARIMFGMKSFKMNVLNYITEIKNVTSTTEMYRGELLPYFRLAIGEAFVASSIQVTNFRLNVENEKVDSWKYQYKLDADKIVVFEHVEFLALALTQGDLGTLMLQVIEMFEERRKFRKVLQKPHLPQRSQPESHIKFESFVSPIKPKQQSPSKKLQQSMKSLASDLFPQKQVYLFVFDCNIKSLEAHVTLNDSMDVIHLLVGSITLKENQIKIQAMTIHSDKLQMLRCNSIDIKLPRNHSPLELQREHNVSLQMKFTDFQSPIKSPQKEPLLLEQKVQTIKKEIQPESKGTQITIDGVQINFDMKCLSQIIVFSTNLVNIVQNSRNYMMIREKIEGFTLGVLEKREKIQGIIEKGTQTFQNITENLRAKADFSYEIKWIVDVEAIMRYVRVETLSPINVEVLSIDQKELLNIELGARIDHPYFINSFVSLQVKHFNRLIQIYEPVLEKVSIKLEKVDRKFEFRVLIVDIKAVVTQDLIMDFCRDLKSIKDKMEQSPDLSNALLINDLQAKKIELYQRFYGCKNLVQSTLKDLQQKQSHILENQIEKISQEQHRLDNFKKQDSFSKFMVKNYTQCEVLCSLNQESFPRQQIHVHSEYKLENIGLTQVAKGYFMIPYNKTAKNYSTPTQFLDREFSLKLKLNFISQKYAFTSINFETLLSEISHLGEKRLYIEVFYEDSEGERHSSMIQIFMAFDYRESGIVMEIRPRVEIVNYSVVELGVSGTGKEAYSQIKINKPIFSVPKGKSMFLPLWVDQQISLKLNNYQSKQPASRYTIPINSQQSLQQNYPTENYLLLKEQFIHYFQVKLGSEFCWIPLLFVRLKKFEKIKDKETEEFTFKEVKCKIMVMPLVKIENHCGRELWINGEKFSSRKVNYQKEVQIQQAVYFFLHHQYTKSIESILFSFHEKGFNYHISLPSNSQVSKALKFPTEVATMAPIALNILSTKNEFGQMILHFYPMVEVLMELPFEQVKGQMSCKYGQEEKQKICQGFDVERQAIMLEKIPTGPISTTSYLISDQCKKLKFSLDSEGLISQSRAAISSELPNKRSLGYIDIFGEQFSTSQSDSSSSSSSSSESISVSQFSEDTSKIQSKIIYVPTTTKLGEMFFAKYEMRRVKKTFLLEEQLASVYVASELEGIREKSAKNRKFKDFYVIELRCIPEKMVDTKQIQRKIVKEVVGIPKVKQISQKVKSKLASRSLVLLIKNLNFSLVVRKVFGQQSFIHADASPHFKNPKISGQRHELVNLLIGEYELNLGLAVDQKFKFNEIQLEQRIGKIMISSINLQRSFKEPILKLCEDKFVSIITGFSINQPKINPSKNFASKQPSTNINFVPQLGLSKLLVKIADKKSQDSEGSHIDIKLTDLFIFQCMNWAIKMYPILSPIVSTNENQSLLRMMMESSSMSDLLKKFEGLILCEQVRLRLSFISLAKKSAHQVKKNKRIQRQIQNQQIENFMIELLEQNQPLLSKEQALAYTESRTMQRILKYLRKIPFNVLQIQKAFITVPEIGINGKISDETASKFERDLLINGATGVLKGMKILGSPGSLIEYVQRSNLKKSQKITGLLNRLAKGSVRSFTGILKAFSNGLSQLTFDQNYMEERQDTMTQQSSTQENSSSKQGFGSLLLGFKSGFAGLVQQPVQNYMEQGAEGFIKGSIKGLTGMFTKPLTGILDLGTKTLEGIKGQKRRSQIDQSHFANITDKIYCRPLFHECSLVRRFNKTEHQVFIILKAVLKRDEQIGLITAYEMKQNPFNQDEKQNENLSLQKGAISKFGLRNLMAICSEKSYFIELGGKDGLRVISKILPHKFIKMIGRSENGVCLIIKEEFKEDEEQELPNKIVTEMKEILLDPVDLFEKEDIYRLYKKLAKK